MFNALLVLTRARLQIARNSFWRGGLRGKIGLLVMAALLSLSAVGIYGFTRTVVRALRSPRTAELLREAAAQAPGLPTDVAPFLAAIPSVVLLSALGLLIFSSFSSLLSSLYLSGDIDMLLAAPVPMRAVFVVKFFGGLLVPYLLLFFLIGPFLLGYGNGLGFGAAFFATALLTLFLLPLLPTGLGALLVMAVVRVIPARRAREIVGVLGGLVGVSWYIASQFSRQLAPRVANAGTLDYLRRFDNPISPSAWAGRSLIAAGEGNWGALALYGGLFAALSIGVFLACLLLAERLYYAGWSNISTQGGRVRRRTMDDGRRTTAADSSSFVFRLSSKVLPAQSAAVLWKDLRIFPRDLRNLQQLIFPVVLAGIWSFQLLRGGAPGGRGDGAPDFFRVLSTMASAGISFYICLVLSSALGGAGISREGRGFWLYKVAPMSSRRLLLGKLALAYLPYPTIGTLFVVLLSILQGSAPADFARSLALVLIGGLGTTSITVGMGAAFPKFNWENPRQQTSVQAGCLAPILYLLYLGLAIGGVLALPMVGSLVPDFATVLALAGWVIFLGLTALAVWASFTFGAARLDRVEVG